MLPDLQLAVRLQDLDNRVAELTREIAALPKHTHEIEKKLEIHERKLEADRAALSANQKERKQMEGEIQVQEQKISKLRGQMLDAEPLDRNLIAAEAALKQEKSQVEAEKQEARQRTAADQKQLDELQAERKKVVAGMNPNLYRHYERVRRGRRGLAVVEAVDGRCTGCHMAMRLQFFQDLKHSSQVLTCESCGRILYYNPPQSFEDLTGEAAGAVG